MRVLVAEDHAKTAFSFCAALEAEGHEVCVARDGQEAVDLVEDFRPELAMLDISMPKLTGFEAAMQIRKLLPDVVLVAVTGWPVAGREVDFQAAGFDYAAMKPVSPCHICSFVGQCKFAQRGIELGRESKAPALRDSYFRQWRAADAKAQEMERVLNETAIAALDGDELPPTDYQRICVMQLRREADDLFRLAMQEKGGPAEIVRLH